MFRLLGPLVACGAIVASSPAFAQAPPALDSSRVLVLPFDNPSREPRLYWLSEGASLLLTQELAARGTTAISRDERLAAFQRLQVPPVATLSRASVIRLGELVGAAEVVTGSVALSGNTFEVRARRIQLDSGRMDQMHIEAGPLTDLYPIFERLAPRVLPDAGRGQESAHQHPMPAAFENFVKGLVAESSATQHAYLQAALKAEPTFDQARLALWSLHTEEGDHVRALAVSSEVATLSPDWRAAQFRAALSEIRLTRYDAAFNRLKALQSQAPSAAVLNNLGIVQLRRGSPPASGRATYFFDQAMKLVPDDADHAFNLGYAYWLERDPKSSAYWLRQAVRLNPADGEAHAVLAAALQASGAATESARERELARQLSSEFADWDKRPTAATEPVPRGLERISFYADRPLADAIDVALLASEQREQREVAQFHLERGRRFTEQGQDRDAIAELRRSLYLAPYQTEAHLLLGRLYLRNGRTAEAIDALTISLWSQDTAPARVTLAEAYLAGGDVVAAQREVDRALLLAPDLVEAKTLQERIRNSVR
ncbi:MAG TPA: tetratricopeptide repeat protein [Vicinamibacterales bacterium]